MGVFSAVAGNQLPNQLQKRRLPALFRLRCPSQSHQRSARGLNAHVWRQLHLSAVARFSDSYCIFFYFLHPTHARTTRYEEAFLPEVEKRPRSLRSLGLASLLMNSRDFVFFFLRTLTACCKYEDALSYIYIYLVYIYISVQVIEHTSTQAIGSSLHAGSLFPAGQTYRIGADRNSNG